MSDMSPPQPLPAPKTRRGERTRQKILDAAEREIGRKGFAEASISTITAEAAVGQGTFYLLFPQQGGRAARARACAWAAACAGT